MYIYKYTLETSWRFCFLSISLENPGKRHFSRIDRPLDIVWRVLNFFLNRYTYQYKTQRQLNELSQTFSHSYIHCCFVVMSSEMFILYRCFCSKNLIFPTTWIAGWNEYPLYNNVIVELTNFVSSAEFCWLNEFFPSEYVSVHVLPICVDYAWVNVMWPSIFSISISIFHLHIWRVFLWNVPLDLSSSYLFFSLLTQQWRCRIDQRGRKPPHPTFIRISFCETVFYT